MYAIGVHSKRTCGYEGETDEIFGALARIYYVNEPKVMQSVLVSTSPKISSQTSIPCAKCSQKCRTLAAFFGSLHCSN